MFSNENENENEALMGFMKYYPNSEKVMEKYTPRFFANKRKKQTYISMIICLISTVVLILLIMLFGLFSILFGVTTRVRNIFGFNSYVQEWNTVEMNKFSSEKEAEYFYKWYEETTPDSPSNRLHSLPLNITKDRLHDFDSSAQIIDTVYYKQKRTFLFESNEWKPGLTKELLLFRDSRRNPINEHDTDGEKPLEIVMMSENIQYQIKEKRKCIQEHGGGWNNSTEECKFCYVIRSICVVIDGTKLAYLNQNEKNGYGCFRNEINKINPELHESYYVGKYARVNCSKLDQISSISANGTISVRSNKDPYLIFYDLTKGKLTYGTNFGVFFIVGCSVIVTSAFLLVCVVCFWIGNSTLNKDYWNNSRTAAYSKYGISVQQNE